MLNISYFNNLTLLQDEYDHKLISLEKHAQISIERATLKKTLKAENEDTEKRTHKPS